MSDINPLIRFPLEVQEEVEKLRCDRQNALMITKIIENKYAASLIEQGIQVPTFNDINKYVKWAKKDRGSVPAPKSNVDAVFVDGDELALNLPNDLDTAPAVDSAAEDTVLQSSIDLSTPKNTLEDVKKRLQLSIQRLRKPVCHGGEYNTN